jgi:hypothetical protein
MIGSTRETNSDNVKMWKIALRDTLLSFAYVFISQLIIGEYPPKPEFVYTGLCVALLMGITSYAYGIGAQLTTKKVDSVKIVNGST